MVKDSMDLLELLRKRGVDGDVDFLREALLVLMAAIMESLRSRGNSDPHQQGLGRGTRDGDRI